MPVHDWRRVAPGIYHHFHNYWVPAIGKALNGGILPQPYYALVEQVAGDVWPDVLTLKSDLAEPLTPGQAPNGTVVSAPPQVRFTAVSEADEYTKKRKTLTIRHGSDDDLVAMIEILSPGNKASRREWNSFLDKIFAALRQGIHLLLVDLFPPTPRDPQGIHGAIWGELTGADDFVLPADKPLTQVAYSAGFEKRAFIEPFAVGDALHDMPLFLTPSEHVLVPLEQTYNDAYQTVPRRWRSVLDERTT